MGGQRLRKQDAIDGVALHRAAVMSNEEDVAFLLRTGTWASSQDDAGKTPLMTASSHGHVGVVQVLVEHLPKEALEERAIKGWTALHFAADRGRKEVVRCLLMNGAQASSKDSKGRTPLMHASRRGHLGVVQTLLQMVGDDAVEKRDGEGWTALLFAAAGGHEEVSAFLLSKGAQASSKDHTGMTPLMMAWWRGHLSVVQKLLQVVGKDRLAERDEEGRTPFHQAVIGGHDELVAFLISKGAHVSNRDIAGKTPLMHASSRGHLGVVLRLVEVVGAKGLEDRDVDGWTALHFAVDEGHEDVVAFLLSHGAQADSKDRAGTTPLIAASWLGYVGVMQKFVEVVGAARLEERDENGLTALMRAAVLGHTEVVTLLLDAGVEANWRDHQGRTALMLASSGGHLGVAKSLMTVMDRKGLEKQGRGGWTALHHAASRGHDEVVDYLLSKGARATSKDEKGMTPIMRASRRGHMGAVQRLCRGVGFRVLAEMDNMGWTALYHAADRGHEDVVAFLLSHGAQADSKNRAGATPLIAASWLGHVGVVRMLVHVLGTARLEERDKDGRTALMSAAAGGHTEVVTLLLDAGVEANWRDRQGRTALMHASSGGHLGVVQKFVEVVGAQWLDDRDDRGMTALHRAADRGHAAVVAFLLSHNAQANNKDEKGVTALMRASRRGRT